MLDTLNNLIVVSALLPLSLFVYYYGRYSPWRQTGTGRTMMYKNISFIAVFLVIITSTYFGDYEGRDIVRFVVYTSVVAMFWRNFVNLRNVQTHNATKKTRFIDRLSLRKKNEQ